MRCKERRRNAAQRIDILWPWRVQEPFFGGVRLNSKETRPQTELAARKTLASQTFSVYQAGCSGLGYQAHAYGLLRCRPCKQWL